MLLLSAFAQFLLTGFLIFLPFLLSLKADFVSLYDLMVYDIASLADVSEYLKKYFKNSDLFF